ncbi:MAG: ABC transporter substrate-binding protein [Bdellovibrionales bacterium]|nr:ABC transporter substrate-binding protein [Bdellovibrionales bacterium]MBT3525681.1 ABC transporter substrate-binding protein [Bdellovibrionales bacterium]MBT7669461.1 ABC transporter substrate-binding protein [Bdellovibrionales bacterium]MBT7767853.1 ABC transporter substrate-binding protein [Bdellovibrionales bacterium]
MKYKLLLSLFLLSIFSLQPNILAQAPGVFADGILFGQSAAFRGSSKALGSELYRGSQAYFDHINSQGGVAGKEIRILPLDDGYEGDVTLLNTIKLEQKHKVFGLFGYVGTPTIVKALPVIQKFSPGGLFLFSNFTGAQPQREAPHNQYVFNIRSSYRHETKGLVDQLIKVGIDRIAVFIQYDAYGRSGADGVKRALKAYGKNIVAEATYVRGTKYGSNMKEQVKAMIESKAQAVISIGSYEACAAFIRDARLMNFNAPIANVSFVGSDQLLNLLKGDEKKRGKVLTNNLINSQVVPPWADITIPLVKEYQAMMNRYNPKVPKDLKDSGYTPSKFSFISLEGYLNAKVLVAVLKKMRGEFTRKKFMQTARSITKLDVGLSKKIDLSVTAGALAKVFFTEIKDGKYSLIENWKKFRN